MKTLCKDRAGRSSTEAEAACVKKNHERDAADHWCRRKMCVPGVKLKLRVWRGRGGHAIVEAVAWCTYRTKLPGSFSNMARAMGVMYRCTLKRTATDLNQVQFFQFSFTFWSYRTLILLLYLFLTTQRSSCFADGSQGLTSFISVSVHYCMISMVLL